MAGAPDRRAARREELARAEVLAVRLVSIWDQLRPAVDEYLELYNVEEPDAGLDEVVGPCGGLLVTFVELIQDGVVAATPPVSAWGLEKLRHLGVVLPATPSRPEGVSAR